MGPSRPSRIPDIHLWNISGAELMPNGNLSKHNLPNGVINVVRSLDGSSSGTCQNPLFALGLVKIFPRPSLERLLGGRSYVNWVKSTIKMGKINATSLPLGCLTQTTPEHHLAGSVAGEITFCLSIDCSSALTLDSIT